MATRKGRQAVRNSSNGFPGWGYLVIGVVIGGIVMTVMTHGSLFSSLHKSDGPQANPEATAEHASDPGVVEPAASSTAPKKPQYDFYSVLSEKEVRIPDAQINAQARAEQQQKQQAALPPTANTSTPSANPTVPAPVPAAVKENVAAAPVTSVTTSTAGNGYLLQVGAFPNAADAETLKAKLAMQGFIANVQTVTIGGQAYHRVRLGPYASATALESTKQRLSSAGINAIALKEGK